MKQDPHQHDDEGGPWFIWDDSFQPIAEDISYDEMKRRVDAMIAEGRNDVYGENNDSGGVYPPDMPGESE